MAEIFCGDRRAEAAGPVPRGIGAADWDLVSAGVRQRVLVLEAFLADVYGPGRAFDDGVVPWRALFTSGTFRREAAGLTPPNGVRVHLAGIDLVRDERGGFWVLGDNVCVPSGDGYLLADRLACARLLGALRAAAPRGVADPLVVMLTPGAHDDAYLEHALLARHMGVELVEGRDLSCRHGRVYAHTTRGSRPVDVIWRRVDDDWLDPLHFRPDSPLGCPGLVNAARRGTVTIANGIGNGVAQDRLVYPYLPDLIRYYLAEDPILDNAGPGRLGNRDVLRTFAVNDGTGIWVLPGGV
ncbi:MAG TPA: circularly permuted type 2 ATP-grasp protein, partial [Trebonia sp.]